MIYALLAIVALAVLAPVLLALRGRAPLRGARQLALDLHATQLRELDRDLAEARILPDEHKIAVLEVQRRMLAAAAAAEAPARPGARWPLLAALVAIPVGAGLLYWASGAAPGLPSRDASPQAQQAEGEALLDMLRVRLSLMDPATDRAREGYALLGKIEENRGHFAAAADAYRAALTGKFDPVIAVRAAEAQVRADGGVTDRTAALYGEALAAEPQAPWRGAIERRLAQPRIAARAPELQLPPR